MEKLVIIIPTYNEAENIAPMVTRVREVMPEADILVVDDNSPDGTGAIVRDLMKGDEHLQLLMRAKKEGLGRAYLHAFSEVLKDQDVAWIQIMDADFSHDPAVLPKLLMAAKDADVVIGSRYVHGGGMEKWVFWRRLLSQFASRYCRVITGMPVQDGTAGFMLMRASLMRTAQLEKINTRGYAFLMELKFRLWKKGARITEVPIIFGDRNQGVSKMSRLVIIEGVIAPWILRFKKQ